MNGTLPGCIGYHGKPAPPNGPCRICRYQDVCMRVIAKDRLKPIFAKILEIEATLKGGE